MESNPMTYKTHIAHCDGETIEIRYRVGHLPDEEVKKALDALVRLADSYLEKPPPRGYWREVPPSMGFHGSKDWWLDPEPLPRAVEIDDDKWFREWLGEHGRNIEAGYNGGQFTSLVEQESVQFCIYDMQKRKALVTAPTREKAIRALREKIEESDNEPRHAGTPAGVRWAGDRRDRGMPGGATTRRQGNRGREDHREG